MPRKLTPAEAGAMDVLRRMAEEMDISSIEWTGRVEYVLGETGEVVDPKDVEDDDPDVTDWYVFRDRDPNTNETGGLWYVRRDDDKFHMLSEEEW